MPRTKRLAVTKNSINDGTWVSIWLGADLKHWLRVQSAKEHVSMSTYVRALIEKQRHDSAV